MELADLVNRLEQCNHYEALGVAPDATRAQIRAAYLRLAREHRHDGEDPPLQGRLFERLTRAWETLGDPDERRRYDARLAGEDPLLADPAERILRADEVFREGLALAEQERWSEARERFETGVKLHPDEREFAAWLAFATWASSGRSAEDTRLAADSLRAVLEEEPRLRAARALAARLGSGTEGRRPTPDL